MEVTYRVQEGFRLPNLLLPQEAEANLGRYAELRRQYIKKHRRVLYTNLKTSGQLAAHLAEIETAAEKMVTRLVAQMAQECSWSLNPQAATALFTGMVTDSGRFRYDATNALTFRLASYLMEQPIDTNALYRNLYASDYAQLVVRAKLLLHVQFTEKNVAYVYTTMDGKAEYGVDDFTLSRGMVNSMADMRGVDIWVNFTESDKGVLCELRSSRFNINPIAVKYGGGGHMKASGATLKNREEAMAMLHDLDEMMGESK